MTSFHAKKADVIGWTNYDNRHDNQNTPAPANAPQLGRRSLRADLPNGPSTEQPTQPHGNSHHHEMIANPWYDHAPALDTEIALHATRQQQHQDLKKLDPKRILVSKLINQIDSHSKQPSDQFSLSQFRVSPGFSPLRPKDAATMIQTSSFGSPEALSPRLRPALSYSPSMAILTPGPEKHLPNALLLSNGSFTKHAITKFDQIDQSSPRIQITENAMALLPKRSTGTERCQDPASVASLNLAHLPLVASHQEVVESINPASKDRIIPDSQCLIEATTSTKSPEGKPDTFVAPLSFIHVETELDDHLYDCYNSHAAQVKESLRKARTINDGSPGRSSVLTNNESPFVNLKPLQVSTSKSTAATENEEKVEQTRYFGGPKSKLGACHYKLVPVTTYDCVAPAVPTYASYIPVQESILGENEVRLFSWPWFEDGYVETKDLHEEIKQNYEMLIDDRLEDLLEREKSKHVKKYVIKFLKRLGCAINDVLRYLLDPEEVLNLEPSEDVLKAFGNRSIHYSDISRRLNKWNSIMNDLGSSTPRTLAIACLACEVFSKKQGFSLWHVVKLSIAFDEQSETIKESQLAYSSTGCAICQIHNCPIHGGFDVVGDDSDYEFDSDSPEDMNHKKNVISHYQAPSGTKQSLTKKGFEYWQRTVPEASNIPKRAPFYPCHHEGSCTSENCRCVRNKVTCEKTCACPANCHRRFQGCTCAKSGKACWQSKKCDCFLLNRECDPDLCETCGASEVLDPANQVIPNIAVGRCLNVAMQRNIPKRTLAGNSEVAGFGLFMGEPAKRHEFIGEYKGEVIAKEEGDRRGTIYARKPMEYLFNLDQEQEVDSTNFGNKTRFINHPSEPGEENCYPRPTLCNTIIRIGLFASRDIAIGEELFFDYGGDFWKSKGIRKQGGTQLVPVRIRKPTTAKTKAKTNGRRQRNGVVPPGSKRRPISNSKVASDQEAKANMNVEAGNATSKDITERPAVSDDGTGAQTAANMSDSEVSAEDEMPLPMPLPATDSEDESYRSSRRESSSEPSSESQRQPRRSQRKRRRSS